MKCVIINFKNAGIFLGDPTKKSSDKVLEYVDKRKTNRLNHQRMNIPVGTLSKRHISNLLHVLMGERPSPSLRKTNIPIIQEIKKLADSARVKVESIIYKDYKDNQRYCSEFMSGRKIYDNSNYSGKHLINLDGKDVIIQGGFMTWERLKHFLGQDLFNDFVQLSKNLIGEDSINNSAENIISKLSSMRNKQIKEFADKCVQNKRTGLAHLLNFKSKDFEGKEKKDIDNYLARVNIAMASDIRVKILECKSVERIAKIKGTIIVPMPDEMIEKLKNGTGMGTFLEGGLAYISSIQEYSDSIRYETVEPVE